MGVTDGKNWIADDRMFSDHDSKLIRYGNISKTHVNQVHRLTKYCYTHGFNPVPGVLRSALKVDNLEEYYNFINDDLTLVKKQEEYVHDE